MDEIKNVVQLIPEGVVTEYVKMIKRGCYKTGFVDGLLTGTGVGLGAAALGAAVGGITLLVIDIYNEKNSVKGETKNGSKSTS